MAVIQPKTLKNKLIAYFTLIALIPSIVISIYHYNDQIKLMNTGMIQNVTRNLGYVMKNVEKQMKLAEQLSDWTFMNSSIEKLFLSSAQEDKIKFNLNMMVFQDTLSDLLLSSSMEKYISAFLLVGNNGVDIRAGNPSPELVSKTDIDKYEWFQNGITTRQRPNEYYLVENPSSIKFDKYIIPIVRPVIHSVTDQQIGWSFIGFKPLLISEAFENYNLNHDESIFLIDPKGTFIYHSDPFLIGTSIREELVLRDISEQEEGYFTTETEGKKRILVYYKSQLTGWTIIQEMSNMYLTRQRDTLILISLLICLAGIFISAVLASFLSYNLTSPLRNILTRMQIISTGDFSKDLAIEGDDELGNLGRGINQMSESINVLMDKLIKEEAQKRKLELKMLQNQINPHFLYNTLNSIRWMAIIQKADGVRDAITSLGRLLKNSLGDMEQETTIRDEITVLDEYIQIQKLRYKDKVEVCYRIEDKRLMHSKILKMTLQPLVENAMFHGIEPKNESGTITISVKKEKDRIVICVEDDGIGMTDEQMRRIFLEESSDERKSGYSAIGIKNVDERIKLVYGAQYGIRIESEPGQYTKVLVEIPLSFETETIEGAGYD